jgi:hypothetical protein
VSVVNGLATLDSFTVIAAPGTNISILGYTEGITPEKGILARDDTTYYPEIKIPVSMRN